MNKAAACAVGGFCPIVRSTGSTSYIPVRVYQSHLYQISHKELSMAVSHYAMKNGQICLQDSL
jgi:hypothetical protein